MNALQKKLPFKPYVGNDNRAPSFDNTAHVIAELEPSHPCYLFSSERLTQQAKTFLDHFPGEVSYAVKVNSDSTIIKHLMNAGISSFDVASIHEIQQVHSIYPKAALHFNNPIKSDEAILQSYHIYDVRSFVVDDLRGLNQVISLCEAPAQSLEITVRFALPHQSAEYDFGSKFGANPKQAIELLKKVKEYNQLASITFHPGSQCVDPQVYRQYIEVADDIVTQAGCDINRLNVGGGFPARYENYQTSSLKDYFEIINNAFQATKMHGKTELLCEPGRAMVADCISLLTQVIHRRDNDSGEENDNGEVFINDGIYGSFMEQNIIKLTLPVQCWHNDQVLTDNRVMTTVFGPTCDPTDRLPDFALADSLQIGDWLEFGMMGAYSSATATNFNGFELPKLISVKEHSFCCN